jgi:enoyl-CoA hydratase/carnithine racemase
MKPHTFDQYKDKYETISLERNDEGILLVRIHDIDEPDQPIRYYGRDRPYGWQHAHTEWSHCFYDISRDYDNEVIILTGTGDKFIGTDEDRRPALDAAMVGRFPPTHPDHFDHIYHNGKQLQQNLLNIECPVIGVANGPAVAHAELLLLSDIVLCAEHAEFQDQPHFETGMLVPGDSVGLVFPLLMGHNRGSYFLLTGQTLSASEALQYGLVNEVHPGAALLDRAYELARRILKRPKLVRRYSRAVLRQSIKEKMLAHVGFALALEGLAGAGRRVEADTKSRGSQQSSTFGFSIAPDQGI